ncbi:MAG: tRNA (N(6)-L-threonylcarbamoyladenosine(37)-C(2))-methylthiotransferase MtaB [Mycoplasmataceae bacterium]|jgi:threonylcarbamoyladenosine tRNA methylthiotransferase MtaB|nr:tRNA (N(6)-L-threonylcarbamoyladenosine(37)-C(2))-methylthiotransferase MtaB [Mycoplasmataceae bacterium]
MNIKNLKFNVISLGCRANIFESNQIIQIGKQNGCVYTENQNGANTVIINTCCVTNRAMSKSKYMVNKVSKLQNVKHIVICGCFSQINQKFIENDKIRLIIGTKYKTQIFDLLKTYKNKLITKVEDIKKEKEFEFCNNSEVCETTRGYLKIQDGCNHNCSYCIIPVARGRQRSLDPTIIVKDIKKMVKNSIKEIVLTGVNTSGYNYEGVSFYDLLKMVDAIKGNFRIRISSLEPFQLNDKIINLLTKNKERFCQAFHICIQSANNEVLKTMNRKYSVEQFVKLCEKIRANSPLASITTDFIVGFPSETTKQFEDSASNLNKIKFANIHIFPFSLHNDTAAAKIKSVCDEKRKHSRYKTIEGFNNIYKKKYLKLFINKTVDVLFEHSKSTSIQSGKSQYFFDVFVLTKKNLQGQMLKVKITKLDENKLFGKIIQK